MNDLYFTGKHKKARKKITFAESVYHQSRSGWISSMQSIVYHQTAGKGMHGYAVMRCTLKRDDIPNLRFG